MAIVLGATAHPAACQQCDGWTLVEPSHAPAPQAQAAMAFDRLRERTVFFNGAVGDSFETWEWNGVDWLLTAVGSPFISGGHVMAYDSKRAVTILVGGHRPNGAYSTPTWGWDGFEWLKLTDGTPSGRDDASMAYDSWRGVCVLFGGDKIVDEDLIIFGDTWEWDGQQWNYRGTAGPAPSSNDAMAFDSGRGVTVLQRIGSSPPETWEWNGIEWSLRSKDGPGRVRAAMVYNEARGACVLFGGSQVGIGLSDETWSWDGQKWSLVSTDTAPAARQDHSMAYDSARHTIVLYGGLGQGNQVLGDTWEFRCSAPCYPDFDHNGVLDLFDFLAFVNSFNAGEAGPADCDGSGELDLFDFLCYTNAFNAGC